MSMAIKMIDREYCAFTDDYRCSFVMDSAEDAKDLPKCCTGSTAVATDKDGPLYMVNASGEWEEL